ncbi:MAG: PEP-CTERM sorting domain-containing protein [Alphaproteobacteria bacterium]
MKKLVGAVATAALAVMCAGSAQAIVISVSGQGVTTANAARDAFIGGLSTFVTEGFEGFSNGHVDGGTTGCSPACTDGVLNTLATGVFTDNDQSGDENGGGLAIGPQGTGTNDLPGRDPQEGDRWLDSGDSEDVLWTSYLPLGNSIGFYIADPNDQGGDLLVTATDGGIATYEDFFTGSTNGFIYYVSIFDSSGIASIRFQSRDGGDGTGLLGNDGWGIDEFTVGTAVPEPGTFALLGAGLLGFAVYRRRNG